MLPARASDILDYQHKVVSTNLVAAGIWCYKRRKFSQVENLQTGETQPLMETKNTLHRDKGEAHLHRETAHPSHGLVHFYANEGSNFAPSDWFK